MNWVKVWVLAFISYLICEKRCAIPLRYSRLALLTKILPNTLPLSNNKEKITCSHKQGQNLWFSSQLKNSLSKDISPTSEYHLRQDVQRRFCPLLVKRSLWGVFEDPFVKIPCWSDDKVFYVILVELQTLGEQEACRSNDWERVI